MKKILALILGCSMGIIGHAQLYDWTKTVVSESIVDGLAVTQDSDGNVISTGEIYASADFDPGDGVTTLSSTTGLSDCYIQKLDAEGNFLWAKLLTGYRSQGEQILTDELGNVYVAGSFVGTVDFDPGVGTYPLTQGGSGFDIFMLKLDADGNFIWAYAIEGGGFDFPRSLTTGDDGIYLAGNFSTTVDFDPGEGVYNLSTGGFGANHIFIQKIDFDGNFIWAKSLKVGTNNFAMEMNNAGNLAIAGNFNTLTDLDPGDGVFEITGVEPYNGYALSLDADGNFIWGLQVAGFINDMEVDSEDDMYMAGFFREDVDFDLGPGDASYTVNSWDGFVQKISADGSFEWAYASPYTVSTIPRAIAVTNSGDSFVVGAFSDSINFVEETDGPLYSNGGTDIFILNIDADGNYVGVESFGSVESEFSEDFDYYSPNTIIGTGNFKQEVDFDFTEGEDIQSALSTWKNQFVMKLDVPRCTVVSGDTLVISECDDYTWALTGETYFESGIITEIIGVSDTCDTVAVLDLTIYGPIAADTVFTTVCESYTWDVTGITYTEGGIYSELIVSTEGCDTLATLNLTVSGLILGDTEFTTVCESYAWDVTGIVYTEPGVYTATIPSATTCDTLATLVLSIAEPTIGETANVFACDSYLWEANGVEYMESGLYIATVIDLEGCSTIVTLNLTIGIQDLTVSESDAILTCDVGDADSYQWVDCNDANSAIVGETEVTYSPDENGSYAVVVSKGDCVDTTDCYLMEGLSIADNGRLQSAIVYPNPSNTVFNVDLGQVFDEITIVVTTVEGKVLEVSNYTKQQLIIIDLLRETGVYFVQINTNQGDVKTFKLIKK